MTWGAQAVLRTGLCARRSSGLGVFEPPSVQGASSDLLAFHFAKTLQVGLACWGRPLPRCFPAASQFLAGEILCAMTTGLWSVGAGKGAMGGGP
jgi:hypothetical protein